VYFLKTEAVGSMVCVGAEACALPWWAGSVIAGHVCWPCQDVVCAGVPGYPGSDEP
jgi:hypothetical protein